MTELSLPFDSPSHDRRHTWSDERFSELTRMASEGFSAALIASALGVTRNAVVGKCHRHGVLLIGGWSANRQPGDGPYLRVWTDEENKILRDRWARELSVPQIALSLPGRTTNSVYHQARAIGLRRAKKEKKEPKRHGYGPAIVRDWSTPSEELEALNARIPESQRRTLLELTKDTCRFPVGDPGHPDFFYCGAAPLKGYSYCANHCAHAFRPTQPISQQVPA